MKKNSKNKQNIIKNYLQKKFTNHNLLLLGFGREGQSSYQFLRHFLPHHKITIFDEKPLAKFNNKKIINEIINNDKTKVLFNKKLPKNISQDTFVFKSPGISPFKEPFSSLLEEKQNKIESNTNLFLQIVEILKKNEKNHTSAAPSPLTASSKDRIKKIRSQPLATKEKFVIISQDLQKRPYLTIAITGTKGKSTTANTINNVLKAGGFKTVLIGNIGFPPLNYINRLNNNTKIIMELSSHQIIDLKTSTDIVVLQEINQDHLDYYPDLDSYHQAKSHLARHQKVNQYIIYNPKFPITQKVANLSKAHHLPLTLDQNNHSYMYNLNDCLTFRYINKKPEEIIQIKDIKILGKHNLYNILPGILISKIFNIENNVIRSSIQALKPLPHRLERIGAVKNIIFYNDSLATTTQATVNALKALSHRYHLTSNSSSKPTSTNKGQIILIAGGYERNQNFSQLADQILRHKVKMLFLMSQTAQRLLKSLNTASSQLQKNNLTTPPHFFIQNFKQLQELLLAKINQQKITAHDIILLSPAAASFNLFKNYKDRGNQFRDMFNRIKKQVEKK